MFSCIECGQTSRKWLGRCTACGKFNTFIEEEEAPKKRAKSKVFNIKALSEIEETPKHETSIKELDRVLDGGLTEGSLILLGGEPGVGKSTLLLQICNLLNRKVLYISGEESLGQIMARAKRIGMKNENVLFLAETDIDTIETAALETKPFMVIIDSIQTIAGSEYTPGSVSTIREVSARFLKIAKDKNIATILVGHVTKEGNLAGPKMLEHMVDTVLYFEGDKNLSYRIIRATKNRFGNTNEVGIFKMEKEGLIEIENPSEYMLFGRPKNVAGSVITCTIEGSRPILAECQALVGGTAFGIPRRTVTGCDLNRVNMLLAVLEKKLSFKLSMYDVYINIAGGMKISEPSLDGAIISAVSSSYTDIVIDSGIVVFGEIGLSGELRTVTHLDKRIVEAKKLGFTKCIAPEKPEVKDIEVVKATNIKEVLNALGI
ncbi:MAG: DNA repair protein RadA [Defluviitaleaceae bacterium]|nr:DNA repair protein RadA [Defluviitaleaceae bacterium]